MMDFKHILVGLPVMYLIVVIAMVVVFIAMCMDAIYGWRKAKERKEARTSYLFTRSVNKFLLYEGAMFIAGGIDTLIHFVWVQFATNSIHYAPVVSVFIGVTLCIVEIWSMREKAEEKTRRNLNQAIKVVADVLQKESSIELGKHLIDKMAENSTNKIERDELM